MMEFSLYLITDNGAVKGDLAESVEEALKGGVRAVQLRYKDGSGSALYESAKKLRAITDKYNALLFINDRIDIALAIGADGVHLPSKGMDVKDARTLLGSKLIGVSCHSLEEVKDAYKKGADFVTIGPVFDTASKRQYGEPVGTDVLKDIKGIGIKTFALGGVKLNNLEECFNKGADGVALITGILSAEDIKSTTENYIQKIKTLT